MSNFLVARLALEWLSAERAVRGEAAPTKHDDDLPMAADRVYQVLSGDVRWSHASPGDKHIWRSRFRDVEKFDRWWRQAEPSSELPPPPADTVNVDDNPYNQQTPRPRGRRPVQPPVRQARRREYVNIYDTVQICHDPTLGLGRSYLEISSRSATARLFGAANVGSYRLCNLPVPGQVASADAQPTWFYADTMYATATSVNGLVQMSDFLLVTLILAGKVRGSMLPVRELVMGVPVRTLVDPGTNIEVFIERHCPQSGSAFAPFVIPSFELSIHLEGVAIVK